MANNKSAVKRARQTVRSTSRNESVLTALKTQQKKFRAAVKDGKKEVIHKEFVALSSSLDKAVKKGVIHKNSANRKKASISKSRVGAVSATV